MEIVSKYHDGGIWVEQGESAGCSGGTVTEFSVSTGALTEAERQIIADGCLINYYRNSRD